MNQKIRKLFKNEKQIVTKTKIFLNLFNILSIHPSIHPSIHTLHYQFADWKIERFSNVLFLKNQYHL